MSLEDLFANAQYDDYKLVYKANNYSQKIIPDLFTRLYKNFNKSPKRIVIEDLLLIFSLEDFKRKNKDLGLISEFCYTQVIENKSDWQISEEIKDWKLFVKHHEDNKIVETVESFIKEAIKNKKLVAYDIENNNNLEQSLLDKYYSNKNYFIYIDDFYDLSMKENINIPIPNLIFMNKSPNYSEDEDDIIFKRKTSLLKLLKAADEEFWSNYDPKNPPSNDKVTEWIEKECKSHTLAKAMTKILRDDKFSGKRGKAKEENQNFT